MNEVASLDESIFFRRGDYSTTVAPLKPASAIASVAAVVSKSLLTFATAMVVLKSQLTESLSTPGRLRKAFSTLAVHPTPQVMPGTLNFTVIISAGAVS